MTEEKRPVGRPEKETDHEEVIRLIDEYVSKLENIEKKGRAYRYISNELDTEHNQKIAEEYFTKFDKLMTYRKLRGTYQRSKNKARTLLTLTSKNMGYNDVQLAHDNKVYRYLLFPGLVEV